MISTSAGAPSPRAILFDLDGTLVDSARGIGATIDAVLAKAGLLATDHALLRTLIGAPLDLIFATLAPSLVTAPPSAWSVTRCVETYRALYSTTGIPQTPLFPGILQLLDDCVAADFRLAVVTTKLTVTAREVLAARGVEDRFAAVFGADATPYHKPHPAPALAALALLGVSAEHATVVGDTTYDIEMARAAGCRAVAANWGYGPTQSLIDAGAHHIVNDVPALRTLLLGA